jgi:cell division protein FtsX
MQLRSMPHGTDCDLSWTETVPEVAERVWMRLAVVLAVAASVLLFPVLLVLAIILPSRDRY